MHAEPWALPMAICQYQGSNVHKRFLWGSLSFPKTLRAWNNAIRITHQPATGSVGVARRVHALLWLPMSCQTLSYDNDVFYQGWVPRIAVSNSGGWLRMCMRLSRRAVSRLQTFGYYWLGTRSAAHLPVWPLMTLSPSAASPIARSAQALFIFRWFKRSIHSTKVHLVGCPLGSWGWMQACMYRAPLRNPAPG